MSFTDHWQEMVNNTISISNSEGFEILIEEECEAHREDALRYGLREWIDDRHKLSENVIGIFDTDDFEVTLRAACQGKTAKGTYSFSKGFVTFSSTFLGWSNT